MIKIKKLYKLREELHKNPEKGFSEHKTREILRRFIENHSLDEQFKVYEVVKTGLVIEYKNGGNKPYILLRADMDALPLTETTGVDFSSENEGWMHACGHDVHMTVLAGTILKVAESCPEANVLFFYQPAEEGPGGANPFLESGFLDSYDIKGAAGLHVTSKYDTGTIASRSGTVFSSPTEFDVVFEGSSSHGATPHKGKDTLLPMADFLKTSHELLSRIIPANEKYVFSIGKALGGDRRNIVAGKSIIEGTYRVLKMKTKKTIDDLIRKLSANIGETWGVRSYVKFGAHYPTVETNVSLLEGLKKLAEENEIIFVESEPEFTGEDFGFISQKYPSVFFWLGCGKGVDRKDLHSSDFLPDEKCIEVGIICMYNLIEKIYGAD